MKEAERLILVLLEAERTVADALIAADVEQAVSAQDAAYNALLAFIRSLVEAQPCAVAGEARAAILKLPLPDATRLGWTATEWPVMGYTAEQFRAFREAAAALAAPSAVLPLKGEVPLCQCSVCGRKSWSPDQVGNVCCMTQPDGDRCIGIMAAGEAPRCGYPGCLAEGCNKMCREGAAAPSVEPEGQRLVSITVGGSTHTRTADEWLALARADLAAAPVETEQPVAWMRSAGTGSPVITEDFLRACPRYRSDFTVPLYARPTPAAGVPPELIWTDSDGVTHTMGREGAIKVLREFFAEWPGGLDEIESSLDSLRRRAASPGGVPTGLPTEAIEDAASVLRHIGPQLNAEWAHRCARAAAALSAGAPSSLQGERNG